MSSRLTTHRMTLAVGGAIAVLAAIPMSSWAAAGDLQYLRADNGQQDAISNPANDTCDPVPGGAVNATNRTDATATLYTNAVCDDSRQLVVLLPGESWDSGAALQVAQTVKFTS